MFDCCDGRNRSGESRLASSKLLCASSSLGVPSEVAASLLWFPRGLDLSAALWTRFPDRPLRDKMTKPSSPFDLIGCNPGDNGSEESSDGVTGLRCIPFTGLEISLIGQDSPCQLLMAQACQALAWSAGSSESLKADCNTVTPLLVPRAYKTWT